MPHYSSRTPPTHTHTPGARTHLAQHKQEEFAGVVIDSKCWVGRHKDNEHEICHNSGP